MEFYLNNIKKYEQNNYGGRNHMVLFLVVIGDGMMAKHAKANLLICWQYTLPRKKRGFHGICRHSLNDSFKTCVLCLCMNCTSISKNTKYTNINSMEDRKVLKFDIGNTDVFL